LQRRCIDYSGAIGRTRHTIPPFLKFANGLFTMSTNFPIHKLLLIDDDDDDCFIFRTIVHEISSTFEVKTIDSCKTAMDIIRSYRPELIFLDINLPIIAGHTFLQELKESTIAHLPVVMYSTSDYPKDIERAYQLGASLYFRKVAGLQAFRDSLTEILSMKWHDPESIRMQHYSDGVYRPYSLSNDVAG
jgi:DNA-binding NtrC family response regulator